MILPDQKYLQKIKEQQDLEKAKNNPKFRLELEKKTIMNNL